MIILGIDPGYATIGYGVLEYLRGRFRVMDYGAVTTQAGLDFPRRLQIIHEGITELCDRYRPDCMAIEELFFNSNRKTAVDVCQGRGVILLAAAKENVDIYEYTPLQIKQSVVGYGRAEKQQIMYMTRLILKLDEAPKPDDTADALACAICHGNNMMHRAPAAR